MTRIGRQIKTGAAWTYLQGWLGSVIHFVVGIILARLLDPDQFGVFFAMTAYTAILLRQVQFGIPEALLQAKSLSDRDWNSSFWFMVLIAIFLTMVAYALAHSLGRFYDDSRYVEVMRWMALIFLFVPFNAINGTLLRRSMRFKTLAKINVGSGGGCELRVFRAGRVYVRDFGSIRRSADHRAHGPFSTVKTVHARSSIGAWKTLDRRMANACHSQPESSGRQD